MPEKEIIETPGYQATSGLRAGDRGQGDRKQTGLPANFRQTAPEIHGSLVSPPWLASYFTASVVPGGLV
jgi:hypothetical protein